MTNDGIKYLIVRNTNKRQSIPIVFYLYNNKNIDKVILAIHKNDNFLTT